MIQTVEVLFVCRYRRLSGVLSVIFAFRSTAAMWIRALFSLQLQVYNLFHDTYFVKLHGTGQITGVVSSSECPSLLQTIGSSL